MMLLAGFLNILMVLLSYSLVIMYLLSGEHLAALLWGVNVYIWSNTFISWSRVIKL